MAFFTGGVDITHSCVSFVNPQKLSVVQDSASHVGHHLMLILPLTDTPSHSPEQLLLTVSFYLSAVEPEVSRPFYFLKTFKLFIFKVPRMWKICRVWLSDEEPRFLKPCMQEYTFFVLHDSFDYGFPSYLSVREDIYPTNNDGIIVEYKERKEEAAVSPDGLRRVAQPSLKIFFQMLDPGPLFWVPKICDHLIIKLLNL